jgi:hypothetical protein
MIAIRGGVHMDLNSIQIDCWLCQSQYHVPASLRFAPARDPGWYSQQVSATVWAWVDQRPISDHLADHWPVVVFGFFLWRTMLDVRGVDILEGHY